MGKERFPETSEEDAGAMLISNSAQRAAVQECRKFLTVAGNRVEKLIRIIRGIRARSHIPQFGIHSRTWERVVLRHRPTLVLINTQVALPTPFNLF